LVNEPNDVGIEPDILLSPRCSTDNPLNNPRDDGIVPTLPRDDAIIDTTCPFLQVTQYQFDVDPPGQASLFTELEPLQSHDSYKLLLDIPSEEAKSHKIKVCLYALVVGVVDGIIVGIILVGFLDGITVGFLEGFEVGEIVGFRDG
jgi:hypothetical protein